MSGTWAVAFVVMWAAVVVLLGLVLALLRQVGVLHVRLDDVQAEVADGLSSARAGDSAAAEEGPVLGEPAPLPARLGYERAPMTVVGFVADGCELSQLLRPALRRVDKQYGDAVRVVELALGSRTLAAFEEFRVEATPFVVCVDRDGVVRARGRARSLPQLESLVASAGAAALAARKAAKAAAPAELAGPAGPTIVLDDIVSAEPPAAAAAAEVASPSVVAVPAAPQLDTGSPVSAPVPATAERDPASASA